MKILATLFLALVAVCARAQTTTTNEPPEFKLIRKILVERNNARIYAADIELHQGKVISFRLYPAQFAANLRTIKTDGLPPDLRVAWFNYVQAWEDRAKQQNNPRALIDLIEMGSTITFLKGFEDLAAHADNKGGTHEAWVAFERECLKAGLDISPH